MSIVLEVKDVKKSVKDYTDKLERQNLTDDEIDKRVNSYLKNQVVIKYSKDWQDEKFNELIYLILEVPGGYFQVQELIHQPHVEFEHYQQKNRRSYEKGNVSDIMAQKELRPEIYNLYKKLNNMGDGKYQECNVDYQVEIPKHL